jgi:hypothetical protein
MVRLLAIPLFIISGLSSEPPITEKPVEQNLQPCKVVEQANVLVPGIFHSGVVAKFGLNKTALRPQGARQNAVDINGQATDNKRENENPCAGQSNRKGSSKTQQTAELVSPFSVNLFF